MTRTEVSAPPETGGQRRDKASVEIYRSVNKAFAWRVVVMAEGDSESALREAQALALTVEQEIYDELYDRSTQRNPRKNFNG